MLINRTELLQKLEAAAPGLASRESIEQSSCFVFRKGRLITYNGDLACRIKCEVPWEGAVAAEKLQTLLQKLVEDEIDVAQGDGEMHIKGKGRRSGIRMEANVTLPIEAVERPGEWVELPKGFSEAVDICVQCTSKDDSQGFYRACLHIHPEYIEACDNLQMARFPCPTGVSTEVLLKRDSMRHLPKMNITHISETPAWLHFCNAAGLILSVRKYLEVSFPDLGPVIAVRGEPTTLPGGLAEAVDKAMIFSGDNADADNVLLRLRQDKLLIRGQSPSGWHEEMKTIKYGGPAIAFMISPKMLTEIAKRHNEVEIGPDQFGVPAKRLRVDGGRYIYMSCLGAIGEDPSTTTTNSAASTKEASE